LEEFYINNTNKGKIKMKKPNSIVLTMAITNAIFASSALAEPEKLEAVTVTTASKVSQNIKNVTANVHVITSVDIEQRGYKVLSEVLKATPGFAFSRYGSLGSLANINMRGFSSKNILILIDGVKQDDPSNFYGGARFENISIDNIERVEIIKGAQSGIWGADAVAGVINIITKRATKNGVETSLNAEYGSFNTTTLGLSSKFKQDDFDGTINLSQLKSDGFSHATAQNKKATKFEADGYENNAVGINLGYNINKNNRINAFLNYADVTSQQDRDEKKASGYSLFPTGDDRRGISKANNKASHKGSKTASYGVSYQNITDNITTKIILSRADFDSFYDSNNDSDAAAVYRSYNGYKGTTDEISVVSSVAYNKEDLFIINVDYRADDYNKITKKTGKSDVILDKSRNNKGISLTNSNNFNTINNDSTIFTQSIRLDKSSAYGDSTTYKLGLKHNFNSFKNLWLSANYGTAFKAPSFQHLYAGDYATPTLEPEKTKSLDFTVHFNDLEITYFKNEITDFIVSRRTPTKHRINLDGESIYEGLEISYATDLDIIDSRVSANYTYTDARDPDKERFLRIPYHQANIFFDYYGVDDLTIGVKVATVGKTLQKNYYLSSSDPNRETTIPLNTKIDLTADYQVNNKLNIYGRIDNVLDNDKPTIINYGVAERSYYLGVRYNFN